MNVFSTDGFIAAFCEALFRDRPCEPAVIELNGHYWRVPCVEGTVPIALFEYIDFFESCHEPKLIETSSSRKITHCQCQYLPRVSEQIRNVKDWCQNGALRGYQAAPMVAWNHFDTWESFKIHVRNGRSNLCSDSQRRYRNLERAVGPLQFTWYDHRPDALEIFFKWKDEALVSQKNSRPFATCERVRLFQELKSRNILHISTLSSAERLLAINIGLIDNNRFYYWSPAYDSVHRQYSPGRLLLHYLLEQSYRLKHKEFDFLWGDESYKWYYSTDVRLITDIGKRPFLIRMKHLIKNLMKQLRRRGLSAKQH